MGSPQQTAPTPGAYRLYKRRFVGLAGLAVLNMVGGMVYPWFGPIANSGESATHQLIVKNADMLRCYLLAAEQFNLSVSRMNWLSNAVQIGGFVFSTLIPHLCARIGTRYCVSDSVPQGIADLELETS